MISRVLFASLFAAALGFVAFTLPATADAGSKVVASGTFTGASDHITTGGVTILETASGKIAVLESDFSLDGAPDPKLGFGKDGYDTSTTFSKLASNNGLQIYAIPASVDPSKYNEFYIWCEKFSVPLGIAKLK
ncbi:MAG: DM13 domain-containing protein [Pseudomonadota bacterium]